MTFESLLAQLSPVIGLSGGITSLLALFLMYGFKRKVHADKNTLDVAALIKAESDQSKIENRDEMLKIREENKRLYQDINGLGTKLQDQIELNSKLNYECRMEVDQLRSEIVKLKSLGEKVTITADKMGIITNVQGACLSILLYKPDDLLGKNVSTIIPAPQKASHYREYAKRVESHEDLTAKQVRNAYAFPQDGLAIPVLVELETYTGNGEFVAVASISRR